MIFIPKFVCVLTSERYKTYQTGFIFCHLGHAPGGGTLGVPRGSNIFFFQTWPCSIIIKSTGMASRTKCK